MKIRSVHNARSAMLTEYLRYMWSRPAVMRIAVENAALSYSQASPVPIKPLTRRRDVLASISSRRSGLEKPGLLGSWVGRGVLSLLLIAVWLTILGPRPAQAQANPCPEPNVLKFVQAPNNDGGFDVWDTRSAGHFASHDLRQGSPRILRLRCP